MRNETTNNAGANLATAAGVNRREFRTMTTKKMTCPAELRTTTHTDTGEQSPSGRLWECQSCLRRTTAEEAASAARRLDPPPVLAD